MMLATSDNDAAIAVFFSMFIFGGPVFAWVAIRYMKHRERMEMIKHGIVPQGVPGYQAPPRPYAASPQGQTVFVPDSSCVATLRKGITLAFIGLALLIGLSFIGYHDGLWRPGPWLLGGLIPLFVGLAQIVIAVLSGATIDVPSWQRTPGSPPQEPPLYSVPTGSGAAQAPPSGPFTYRPPGDVPEIPKVNPPRSL